MSEDAECGMPASSGLALSSALPCDSRGRSHLTEGLRASQQVAGPRPEHRWADLQWGRGLRYSVVPRGQDRLRGRKSLTRYGPQGPVAWPQQVLRKCHTQTQSSEGLGQGHQAPSSQRPALLPTLFSGDIPVALSLTIYSAQHKHDTLRPVWARAVTEEQVAAGPQPHSRRGQAGAHTSPPATAELGSQNDGERGLGGPYQRWRRKCLAGRAWAPSCPGGRRSRPGTCHLWLWPGTGSWHWCSCPGRRGGRSRLPTRRTSLGWTAAGRAKRCGSRASVIPGPKLSAPRPQGLALPVAAPGAGPIM